jgi:polysaccharide deacetylase family protein (PEP-CTERM system associated)
MSAPPYRIRSEDVSFHPPADDLLPRNAFTVDVEDWYQSCVDYDAPITQRVVRNTDRMLTILDECGVKGTFFVLGQVAETHPKLVRSLVEEGHEVQSHGYSHRALHTMNPAELRNEIERGKKTVEDASGTSVTAFRAGDFSIGPGNLWALETLADLGFRTDSSIFPMRLRRYGIADWRLGPHQLLLESGRRILEIPVAIWAPGRFRIPVSGGGYVRLLPYGVIARGIQSIESEERPAVLYCHPYEFNSTELAEFRGVSRRLRYSQGMGRRTLPRKVYSLLTEFRFGTLRDVMSAWSLG